MIFRFIDFSIQTRNGNADTCNKKEYNNNLNYNSKNPSKALWERINTISCILIQQKKEKNKWNM